MGVAVSAWSLAAAVSKAGQLGVVSGTSLDTVLARRLQSGDPGGHVRRGLCAFPYPEIAQRVLETYFIPCGKAATAPFKLVPMFSPNPSRALTELAVVANFVEVFLAKEGHSGKVGINYLEKIQLPTLPSIFGAMLAGVDYVLMGAGIPRAIPGILDAFATGLEAKLKLDVEGAEPGENFACRFDPRAFCGGEPPALKRPHFLAIISSATLALTLAKKSSGRVDGFVVEGISAGGHNAPPRGEMKLDENGEPIYGERDVPDLEKIKSIGLPFWLAGSCGQPGKLAEALHLGAAGVQVGTPFAFCEESGIDPALKRRVIEEILRGEVEVFTDPIGSPTGFPFKVVQMKGTVSEYAAALGRKRICDLGYLRHLYRKPDGTVGFRCPGEPEEAYLRKGGKPEDTVGRKCVCNGLLATAGLAQIQSGDISEIPLLTAGDNLMRIVRLIKPGTHSYTAADVIESLLD